MENTKQSTAEVDPRYPNTPIGIVRSRDAFLRDLPTLLANPKYDRWLAVYCGNVRIALAESHAEIIRQCKGRDLDSAEYYMGCVTPYGGDDEEIEGGGHEFDDVELENGPTPPCEHM